MKTIHSFETRFSKFPRINKFILFCCATVLFSLTTMVAFTHLAIPSVTPEVSGGHYHSLALKSDGTVWTWGYEYYGNYQINFTPVQVIDLSEITAISAGWYHNFTMKSDGTVWTWGSGTKGQLGDGINKDSSTPVQTSKLTDVTAIDGGGYHNLALKSDGTVWAWGDNSYGQLGDGTNTNKSTPSQISGLRRCQ